MYLSASQWWFICWTYYFISLIISQLNLKNDTLRRRYDSLKYDIKKVEEGMPAFYFFFFFLLSYGTTLQWFTMSLFEGLLPPPWHKPSNTLLGWWDERIAAISVEGWNLSRDFSTYLCICTYNQEVPHQGRWPKLVIIAVGVLIIQQSTFALWLWLCIRLFMCGTPKHIASEACIQRLWTIDGAVCQHDLLP